jgi:hypothetical protein
VKLFALAVRLEESFQFLICRDWYRDSKNFIVREFGVAGGSQTPSLQQHLDRILDVEFKFSERSRVYSCWGHFLFVRRITSLAGQSLHLLGHSFLVEASHPLLGRNICEKGSILVGGGVIILSGRVLYLLWSKFCGQGRFLLVGGASSIAGHCFSAYFMAVDG